MAKKTREHLHPAFLAIRVTLGVAFLFFGLEKFTRLDAFADIVAGYRLPWVEYPMDEWIAYTVASAEAVLGLCLIFRFFYRPAILMQGMLMASFVYGVIHLRLQFPDEERDCGCFPWESSSFWPHLIGLGLGILILVVLWQEDHEANKHRFKGDRLKLP